MITYLSQRPLISVQRIAPLDLWLMNLPTTPPGSKTRCTSYTSVSAYIEMTLCFPPPKCLSTMQTIIVRPITSHRMNGTHFVFWDSPADEAYSGVVELVVLKRKSGCYTGDVCEVS